MPTANLQPEKSDSGPQIAPYYRPDESRRLELARQWIAVARGQAQEPKQ